MKIKMVSLLAVTALLLSLCACGGQATTNGKGEELGAGLTTETSSSPSQTTGQPVSGTGTTSGQTETASSQTTTTTQTGTTTRALEVLKRGNSIWKEVPIKEETNWVSESSVIDLKKAITNADYVFSGRVINRKEYEVSWTDKEGKSWGPYSSSIIEVEVNHNYYGESPVKDNIIKLYYPNSLSTVFEDSALIKDQGEYVFVTRALDDKYVERRKKETPEDGSEPEKYADAYIPNPYYSLLPIDNGTVFMYNQYFDWNKGIMKKAKSNVETDKISSKAIENGAFIALDKKDFDSAFLQVLKNPEVLPSANTQ